MTWTTKSKKEFDVLMKQEEIWQAMEYAAVGAKDFKNADHAHEMRWRCMNRAVEALELEVSQNADCAER
jgi:hypothetical protein